MMEAQIAEQRTKRVDDYSVELRTFVDAGGIIEIWNEASEDDVDAAERLPHIFKIKEIDGIPFTKMTEAHYMHAENAEHAFDSLSTARNVLDLCWKAM